MKRFSFILIWVLILASTAFAVDPDEEFTMGWCVTSQNITVSLNDLLDRDRFRVIDCLELLYVWEDPTEDEIVSQRAAWLRNKLCFEIYGANAYCAWEPWTPAGFRSKQQWVSFLRNTISFEKEMWLRAKMLVKRLESLNRKGRYRVGE